MKECKKAGYSERLAAIVAAFEAQRDEIEAGKLLGESTKDITEIAWRDFGKVPTTPTRERPRVLFRRSALPNMRRHLRERTPTNAHFKELVAEELENNGALSEAYEHLTGRRGVHNFSNEYLEVIQAKALAYLLEDEPLYGYQAIVYLKSYLLTLDLQHIYSDQCREFGYVMFVAACVYDWCYPLLTDIDKEQIIAGVETRTAAGDCGDPSREIHPVYKRKMEVGFPPCDQGSVSGHGSEGQILRNHLSFAVAIYGDNDSWWELVGARIYNDYVPVRSYYYRSGISQQGTGNYIKCRHMADLFSAWILKAAVGAHPYVGIERVMQGVLGYECAEGKCFAEGDGTYDLKPQEFFDQLTMTAAYVFEDPYLLRWAEDLLGDRVISTSTSYLTAPLYIILRGTELRPAEDRYAKMSLIQYNGAPIGQYISRRAWRDADGCATYMKIKEITTANHEHKDAGSFEIYYKAPLTCDAGCYANYGHEHTQFYHQMTVAHNCLEIFNPARYNPDSENKAEKFYTGGQIRGGERSDLASWLGSPDHRTGSVTGRDEGYYDGDRTRPHYAYIAGDITRAYFADTVSHVERRMLTVYTEDETAPMAFFVYDDVEATDPSFEKRFLLHIASGDAPVIDGERIITENGGGRLTCHALTEGASIRPLGGRAYTEDGRYDPAASKNYMVNGKNLTANGGADDKHWGRVEIVAPEERSTRFLTAMYVSDAGADLRRSVSRISGEGCIAALYDGRYAAVFATDREGKAALSLDLGDGEHGCYISGLAGGKWRVTVDGESSEVTVHKLRRFLNIKATGRLELEPID